ncbi:Fatty acid oxidation complex subunit alpha [compost metagenome]
MCDGFIGNRMIEHYSRQAGFLLDEGATPQQVDKAIEKFGFAMGPFRMSDLAGNDIGLAIRRHRAVVDPGMKFSGTADKLCDMGRLGQKTGAGWYDYQPGKRDAIPSDVVLEMIEKHRRELGIKPRKFSDKEIVERLVYALVNEGARVLEDGIASKSGDIDVVYLTGYGFPMHRGGPMRYASQVGLFNVAETMRRFASNPHDDASFWEPAPLIKKLIAGGKQFN